MREFYEVQRCTSHKDAKLSSVWSWTMRGFSTTTAMCGCSATTRKQSSQRALRVSKRSQSITERIRLTHVTRA